MRNEKAPPLIFQTYIYQYYNAVVGPMMTISVRYSKSQDFQHWGHFLNIFNAPLPILKDRDM